MQRNAYMDTLNQAYVSYDPAFNDYWYTTNEEFHTSKTETQLGLLHYTIITLTARKKHPYRK